MKKITRVEHGRSRWMRISALAGIIIPAFFLCRPPLAFPGIIVSTFPPAKVIQKAAKHALPAVVHIQVAGKPGSPGTLGRYFSSLSGQSPLPDTLGDLAGANRGTGVLIDPRGFVITNAFLVEGARDIRCFLLGRRWLRAKRVGTDPKTDIGVIKIIESGSYPAIHGGDSGNLTLGQWIVALGHYEPGKPTIATGIICAEHRKGVLEPETPRDFLQADTQIDLVNSGGPLVDLKGNAVGLSDALLTRVAPLHGIGFAIPWALVMHVARQLMEGGAAKHGWLGLQVQGVILRSKNKHPGFVRGVMVLRVAKDSPADKAGIRPGDFIVSLGHVNIRNVSQLKHLVSSAPAGRMVTIELSRKGKMKIFSVTIGTRDEKARAPNLKSRLGITVVPVTKVPFPGVRQGLVITWVNPYGPMGRAGFEPRDIILEANGVPLKTAMDLGGLLHDMKPGSYIIFHALDHRAHRKGYVQIRLP